jgi:hypothetical protein
MIRRAIDAELTRVQPMVDGWPGLRSLSFTVKLKPDGGVRAVIIGTDSENAAEIS